MGAIKIDHRGAREILKSAEMGRAVHTLATEIAADVSQRPTVVRNEAEVEVTDYVTDRRCSAVTIKHPGGLAMQAKYGVLTKAMRIQVREERRAKARVASKARRAKEAERKRSTFNAPKRKSAAQRAAKARKK